MLLTFNKEIAPNYHKITNENIPSLNYFYQGIDSLTMVVNKTRPIMCEIIEKVKIQPNA
jgi:hypothetical protein